MRSKLLYVVKGEKTHEKDGFHYARELSHVVHGGLYVLFHYDRQVRRTFEDEMAAAALAEAGAADSAIALLREREENLQAEAEKRIEQWRTVCDLPERITGFQVTTADLLSVIRKILQDEAGIEIVLMSPSLMEENRRLTIRRLKKYIRRPIVTMSRQIPVEERPCL